MKKLALLVLMFSVILAGCGQPAKAESNAIVAQTTTIPPTATVEATETSTVLPTITIYPSPTPTQIPVAGNGLLMTERTVDALDAATKAAATMPGAYSWADNRHCSSYVAEYMRQLGFNVNGPFNPGVDSGNAFPWSNVVSQVNWLRLNYPQGINDAPLIDFLNGKLWDKIPPGSIIYLQTAIGHNGYNDYYHVVVLIGYKTDGSPQFAEFSGIMKSGPSVDRSLWEMAGFYPILPGGGWDVRPFDKTGVYPPPTLMVTWIDPMNLH